MLGLIKGLFGLLVCVLATIFVSVLLHCVGFFKFLLPKQSWRDGIRRLLNQIALLWVDINTWLITHIVGCQIEIVGDQHFDKKGWYFVISNHVSWVDILAIARSFHRTLPPPRFLMKSGLIWLPFVGTACWLLDYPFLKRYSKKLLATNKHLKGRDTSNLKRLCEKFKRMPLTIINYIEGTRYNKTKAAQQKSPYKHLLKPRAGGFAIIMENLGHQLSHILNITVCYPDDQVTFWRFLRGKVKKIKVFVEKIPVTPDLIGDANNEPYRQHLQEWLNAKWQQKDRILDEAHDN